MDKEYNTNYDMQTPKRNRFEERKHHINQHINFKVMNKYFTPLQQENMQVTPENTTCGGIQIRHQSKALKYFLPSKEGNCLGSPMSL
jgi:hypothetical protein